MKVDVVKGILHHPETDFYGRIKNIALGFIVMVIWLHIIIPFFNFVEPPEPPDPFFIVPKETFIHILVFGVISAALWEEVVFRWFPLYLTKKLSNDYKIPVILATSAIFGYIHGGPWHVWVQGVSGLVLACVYIKNGYHYWSAVILHGIWNYMCFFSFHFN